MSIVGSIIRKDLVIEYRTRQAFITILFFGLLVLAVGNFALGGSGQETTVYGPGVLWIAFLFSGLLFLNHVVQIEKEENTFTGIMISPATPGQIFIGKMLSAVQSMAVQLSSMAESEMFVRLPVEGRPARALLRSSRKRPGKYLNHIGRT